MLETRTMFISDSDIRITIREVIAEELAYHLKNLSKPVNKTLLLSRKDVASYLGVSLPTIHTWTKNGTIKGYRISGRIKYKLEDIESALKEIQTIKFRRESFNAPF